MRKLTAIITVFLIVTAIFSFRNMEEHQTLKIGEKAPMIDLKMESTQGETYSLDKLNKSNGTLVIFSCNTCPFVIAWEDRYPELANISKVNEIGFALINSNEAKRAGDDSMNEMIAHAKDKGYPDVPYLVDQNSTLANAFGAKTTPHVFLFNSQWELVYEGAIDDNHKSADNVENHYLKNALNNLKQNKPIDPNDTKAIGCSIKRVKV